MFQSRVIAAIEKITGSTIDAMATDIGQIESLLSIDPAMRCISAFCAGATNSLTSIADGLVNGEVFTIVQAAERMQIASTSAADADPAGTGARTVAVKYIDSAGLEQTEIIALNGLTPVDIAGGADIWGVNTVVVVTADTTGTGANTGTLWVGTFADGFTVGKPNTKMIYVVGAEAGHGQAGILHIPTGTTATQRTLRMQLAFQGSDTAVVTGEYYVGRPWATRLRSHVCCAQTTPEVVCENEPALAPGTLCYNVERTQGNGSFEIGFQTTFVIK